MNGTLSLIELAGHVGLLLWGTHMVGTGVQRGFGTVLRRWLGRNLGRRFRAFLTGLGVTALLQSSTATGLLATSFTTTGVITLAPALAVMLGANVGTALLTQVLFFNVALLGPPLVLVGVLVFRWAGDSRAKNIGRIGIGLGLMLMALAGLVHTLGPLENTPLLRSVMGALAGDPVLAALIAAALTWACHSSIAIVLLVATFAATHVVDPTGALALVLGANLGGAFPALVDASTSAARRLPLGNLLVRTVGVVLALPFLPAITHALELAEPAPGRLVVDFHLAFNLALAALFLGSVRGLAHLLTRWLPDPPAPADPGRPVYLDVAALDSATVALANAARETLRMADMVEIMLRDALGVLRHNDRTRAEAVAAQNRCVDQLGSAIRRYLADVGDEQTLDHQREGARGQDILSAVINLEHVADIVANSLVEFAMRSVKRGRALTAEEIETVAAMHGELLESLRLALAVFLQAEPRDAKRLAARKGQFREFEVTATALSVRLLRNAAAASHLTDTEAVEPLVEESGLFLRTVRDLRRIHSHLASFAYPILHRPRSRGRRAAARGVAEAGAVNPPAAPLPIEPPKSAAVEEDDLG
ncbi:MAG: Na/Pi cotransporter family protein [Gammaproteobacteria bacterium]|nr:MAG: Na/Pi cotransporter family protein [Gammaproteobacteria bacterium]TLY86665.1 MAG: Na/Pi cotransporter family protein [Gammaproteobacteria bacterium]